MVPTVQSALDNANYSMDADLARLLVVWPMLTNATQSEIMKMIEYAAHTPEK